jgi:hypothetical protein
VSWFVLGLLVAAVGLIAPGATAVGAAQVEQPPTDPEATDGFGVGDDPGATDGFGVAEDPGATDGFGVGEDEVDDEVEVPVTQADLLVDGDGTAEPGAPPTTAPEATPGPSGPSDASLITAIIAGLLTIAVLVALLTWRYWVATRPGLRPVEPEPVPEVRRPADTEQDGELSASGAGVDT